MQSSPRIICLSENKTCENVLLSTEQADALKGSFSKHLQLERSWSGDGYNITAGGHIGTLVVDGLRIHIKPKVPIANLFYMLTYAHDLADFRDKVAPIGDSTELFEFIVEIFVKQVDDLVRWGIHRSYVDEEEDRRYLRGRLLLGTHLRRNLVHASRFHVRTNEFTADLLENRILKTTLGTLSRVRLNTPRLSQQVRRSWSAFSEVSATPVAAADCDQVHYNRLNERYRSTINLARLLLQHLSLEHHAGQTPFATFVLPMHLVFERFVARYLTEALSGWPTFRVSPQERLWLDEDHTMKAAPDIIVRHNRRPIIVLDTKYKIYGEKPKEADVYQMIAYGHTLGIDQCVLIYPSDDAPDERKQLIGGIDLDIRAMSLDGPLSEFKAACHIFSHRIAQQIIDRASISEPKRQLIH